MIKLIRVVFISELENRSSKQSDLIFSDIKELETYREQLLLTNKKIFFTYELT